MPTDTTKTNGGVKKSTDPKTVRRTALAERVTARRTESAACAPQLEGSALIQAIDSIGVVPFLVQMWPANLSAILIDDQSNPVACVQVDVTEPAYGPNQEIGWNVKRGFTDAAGKFSLALPTAPTVSEGLQLHLTGRNQTEATLDIPLNLILQGEGNVGVLTVSNPPRPFDGLMGQLGEITQQVNAALKPDGMLVQASQEKGNACPTVKLGEGETSYALQWGSGEIEGYHFSILYRLIEPEVGNNAAPSSVGSPEKPTKLLAGRLGLDPSVAGLGAKAASGSSVELSGRIGIEQPIDVPTFRDCLEEGPDLTVRARTLGIGYLLRMHQSWKPTHLSLGDLVYSLPLAPGEEQRIAVMERSETLSVQDREAMDAQEYQTYLDAQDTSTGATFQAALAEAGFGASETHGNGWNLGFGSSTGAAGQYGAMMTGAISYGIGYGEGNSSTRSGATFSRNYASTAAEDFHDRLSRQAGARRSATRVGIRLASSHESDQVITKIIANHNHSHALTMQYWEVLRNYDVVTEVDDVQLVCYVPMELIQFLPANEAHFLDAKALQASPLSADMLENRYAQMARYYDVIAPWLRTRPELAEGLNLLKRFVSYPYFDIQTPKDSQYGVTLRVELVASSLPFDHMDVTLVLKNGSRIGPVVLQLYEGQTLPSMPPVTSRGEVFGQLFQMRHDPKNRNTYIADIYVPGEVVDSDFARFEINWNPSPVSYSLTIPDVFKTLASSPGGLPPNIAREYPAMAEALINPVVSLSSGDLQTTVSGPIISHARVAILAAGDSPAVYVDQSQAVQLTPQALPLPVRGVEPRLTYKQLQKIEATFQHVIENTVLYSRAVWMGLAPDERVLLLDQYTIAVPSDQPDVKKTDFPLMNCVANELLGFYGNCMIMPFSIPPQLANQVLGDKDTGKIKSQPLTTATLQTALLRFHRQGFVPPTTKISLPTRGVLGEAVLGASNSSEKVDLTRFWNWQDSPIDHADAIPSGALTQQSLIPPSAVQAPAQLAATTPSMITINGAPPEAIPDVISKLTPDNLTKDTSFDYTGMSTTKDVAIAAATKASEARQQVVEASEKLAEKVLDAYVNYNKGSGATNGGSKSSEGGNKPASAAGGNLPGMGSSGNPQNGGSSNAGNGPAAGTANGGSTSGIGGMVKPGDGSTGGMTPEGGEEAGMSAGNGSESTAPATGGGGLYGPLGQLLNMMEGANPGGIPSTTDLTTADAEEIKWAQEHPGHVEYLMANGKPNYDVIVLWNFDVGSDDIGKFVKMSNGLSAALPELKEWSDHGDLIGVWGYSSISGGQERNEGLSLSRAKNVRDWLTSAPGLKAELIQEPEGYGFLNRYGCDGRIWDPETRARNRAVEIRRFAPRWAEGGLAKLEDVVQKQESDPQRKARLIKVIDLLQEPGDDSFIPMDALLACMNFKGMAGYEWLYNPTEWECHRPLLVHHLLRDLELAWSPNISDGGLLGVLELWDGEIIGTINAIEREIGKPEGQDDIYLLVGKWIMQKMNNAGSIYSCYRNL